MIMINIGDLNMHQYEMLDFDVQSWIIHKFRHQYWKALKGFYVTVYQKTPLVSCLWDTSSGKTTFAPTNTSDIYRVSR